MLLRKHTQLFTLAGALVATPALFAQAPAVPQPPADAGVQAQTQTEVQTQASGQNSRTSADVQGDVNANANTRTQTNRAATDSQLQGRAQNSVDSDLNSAARNTQRQLDSNVNRLQRDANDAIRAGQDQLNSAADRLQQNTNQAIRDGRDQLNRQGARADADLNSRLGWQLNQNRNRIVLDSVQSDSAIARAGLQAGDEIIAVDGYQVSTQSDLDSRLGRVANDGGPTTFTVVRDGRIQTIDANLDGLRQNDRGVQYDRQDGTRQDRFYRGNMVQPPQPPMQRGDAVQSSPVQKGAVQQSATQKSATQKGATQKSAAQKSWQNSPVQKGGGYYQSNNWGRRPVYGAESYGPRYRIGNRGYLRAR